MRAKRPCLFALSLPEDPAFGLVHDDLANPFVLEGPEGYAARRLALDQFEGYGLLHDLCLLFVLFCAAFLRSRRSFIFSSARSTPARALTMPTTPAPSNDLPAEIILSTRLAMLSAAPAGKKPEKTSAARARIRTTINVQTNTIAPLRPPSKRARRPATYPPKK